MYNLFRLCRKDEISFDIVAKNGNSVEAATFDFVERIVRLVPFDNFASTLYLLLVGRGFTYYFNISLSRSISVSFYIFPGPCSPLPSPRITLVTDAYAFGITHHQILDLSFRPHHRPAMCPDKVRSPLVL